ncbi:hypothetical protein [Shewanella pneumatophori]|uniref:Uncharacterized protein n=1 Tax=Shewanella pneumatophori TaxID=314092 RepID=A0A9X2CF51_9GAMM|nr:hypothetical protein [Shewanella pneumatophori]MCL1141048.1 hypothetical protein [Shewanella pneumatophori]
MSKSDTDYSILCTNSSHKLKIKKDEALEIKNLKSDICAYYKLEHDYDLAKKAVIYFKTEMYRASHEISPIYDDEIYLYEKKGALSSLVFNSLNLLKKYHENLVEYGRGCQVKKDLVADITLKSHTYDKDIENILSDIEMKAKQIGEAIRNYCQHESIPSDNYTSGMGVSTVTKKSYILFSLVLPSRRIINSRLQPRNTSVIREDSANEYDLHCVIDAYFDSLTKMHFRAREILLPIIEQKISSIEDTFKRYELEFTSHDNESPMLSIHESNQEYIALTLKELPKLIEYLVTKNNLAPKFSSEIEYKTRKYSN